MVWKLLSKIAVPRITDLNPWLWPWMRNSVLVHVGHCLWDAAVISGVASPAVLLTERTVLVAKKGWFCVEQHGSE